jgi:abhydrolase domain-containing protein 17
MLDRLHRLGFSVFAYDYRGYGTSNGTPSEQNAYQDTDAAYIYLTQ